MVLSFNRRQSGERQAKIVSQQEGWKKGRVEIEKGQGRDRKRAGQR
jgi:hypothetical protein